MKLSKQQQHRQAKCNSSFPRQFLCFQTPCNDKVKCECQKLLKMHIFAAIRHRIDCHFGLDAATSALTCLLGVLIVLTIASSITAYHNRPVNVRGNVHFCRKEHSFEIVCSLRNADLSSLTKPKLPPLRLLPFTLTLPPSSRLCTRSDEGEIGVFEKRNTTNYLSRTTYIANTASNAHWNT